MCVCGARSDKSRQLRKLEQNKSYTHREHKVFPKMRKNRMFQCKKLSATHFKWHSSKCCALISIQNGHRSFTRIIVQNHFHVILFDACKCNAHHNKHNNTRKIKKNMYHYYRGLNWDLCLSCILPYNYHRVWIFKCMCLYM